ncbi:general negative regulator of transcription subunit 5 [Diplodia seriata]|uniref:General negative regulator of transcription subunit n=1 Tax=Diplodia seriata TaxID=420778 RepID=A0A1S8B5L3_9PEZI|nr:General negative regulator of transcription subunit 3 [Diplodia seriata]
MAARKLAQEIDRCFKKVAEGVAAFENIYEKLQQSTNPAQKEKLEDSLKKEIKKLQRSRDQIKAWAASNEIKDKKPLLDQRKLIETQMEKFKAVEKEMKTKAYSKEGLSAASKLDPREKEKVEVCDFLSNMVEELERQVETTEAEAATLQAGLKKSRKDNAKAERIAELERQAERHQWHIGKLELVRRSLENDGIEVEQVKDLEESIRYYVENNQEVDFMEDDSLYDDLNLTEGEDMFGMAQDMDKVSSQDTQSIQDDSHEEPPRIANPSSSKAKAAPEPSTAGARRPSTQLKSPLPTLSTLHTPAQATTNGASTSTMKPAPLPTRAPGEPLKYASAAAAAAASDRHNVGIAPLPPPPGAIQANPALRSSAASSPAVTHAQLATSLAANQRPPVASITSQDGATPITAKSPALSHSSAAPASTEASSIPATPAQEKRSVTPAKTSKPSEAVDQPLTNGDKHVQSAEEESVYHLPSSLQDLLESFEATKEDALSSHADERLMVTSHSSHPESVDADKPRHYRPQNPYPYTPAHYPQEPLSIFDDPRLYSRVDTDSLFYAFYYRQGTYEQYLAAKALKSQSWRFHKQYQTWFQRHEEPKSITEDYEQGTYRFFDYESTWMNRRKAEFKFAYKFLEDDL